VQSFLIVLEVYIGGRMRGKGKRAIGALLGKQGV